MFVWQIKFPHIFRRIPASFLLSFSFIFFLSNLLADSLFPPTLQQKLQDQLLAKPWSSKLHEKLGEYYLSINKEEAQKEYLLAEEFYRQERLREENNVLGTQSSPLSTWQNLERQREKIVEETSFWEKIEKKLPTYHYAKLALVSLYLQLGEKQKAKYYLDKVLKESPTHPLTLRLLEKISD